MNGLRTVQSCRGIWRGYGYSDTVLGAGDGTVIGTGERVTRVVRKEFFPSFAHPSDHKKSDH